MTAGTSSANKRCDGAALLSLRVPCATLTRTKVPALPATPLPPSCLRPGSQNQTTQWQWLPSTSLPAPIGRPRQTPLARPLPVTLFLCESNSLTGGCLVPPTSGSRLRLTRGLFRCSWSLSQGRPRAFGCGNKADFGVVSGVLLTPGGVRPLRRPSLHLRSDAARAGPDGVWLPVCDGVLNPDQLVPI
jgi:hypothetical protein